MRTHSGMMLAAAMIVAAGCGKSETPAEPKAPLVEPNPAPNVDPGKTPSAGWEMDPAKHAIPATPVAGRVCGIDLRLDAQVERDALRFRMVTNEGMPLGGSVIELRFSDPAKSFEGLRLTVKPDQPAGPDVPTAMLLNPLAIAEEPKLLDKGYALTLAVGTRAKGKVSGSIYLSLPGNDKSFIAGTFTADWVRSASELPGADDAPFIQGKIAVTGAKDPDVRVGFLRLEPHDPNEAVVDLIGTILSPGGPPARNDSNRPRVLALIPGSEAKDSARYEFTRLGPGQYWVFATFNGGPAAWKTVAVADGGQANADFTLDAGVFGGLEVTAPGTAEKVSVLPAAESGKPWTESLVITAASLIGLQVDTAPAVGKADPNKPVTVKFPRLAPGKYEVWAGDLNSSVEIKAGETAKLELKKK